ncbi:hypothetical protein FOL47_011097 [Perkinsus chesapeaki]|uniref:HEAT repeat-containing protein 2 n=1 Tax=Perkinsus chesapeaki TaxID=330153 RepID=A0A7J6KZ17_PERCH|nr:hypothetical protein FOL47_011097 [Perkinsus chesapeaki]
MSLPESAVPPASASAPLATASLEEIARLFSDEWSSSPPETEPEARVVDCCELVVAALLSHARTWLGVSRLMQAVHSAGGSGPVEALRWASARLTLVLCENAPVLLTSSRREVGEWCECVALILPHVGDSSLAVRRASRDAMRLLLERNEQSHDRIEEIMPTELRRKNRECSTDHRRPCMLHQLLAVGLADVLPSEAVPALLQHLMKGVHNSDLRAAVSTIDALHLILLHRASSFDKETAAKMISTIFDDAEKLPSGSVLQQKVLACTQVLASSHFDSAISELLEVGDGEFSQSQLHAIRVMVKEKPLLLRMLNCLTDILNNSFPSADGQPNRVVTAATEAFDVIVRVEDSAVVLYSPSVLETSTIAEEAPIEHVLGPVDRLTPGCHEDCSELGHTELGDESPPKPKRCHQTQAAPSIPSDLVAKCAECFLSVVGDPEQPCVRKHAIKGLANVLLLSADKENGLMELAEHKATDILDQLMMSLTDIETELVCEAVNACHRAAVLRPVGCDPELWESQLLSKLGPALLPLTDSPSPILRKSCFYLLSKLCQIAAVQPTTTANASRSFCRVEARIAVTCALRLWDSSPAVGDAVKSCLAMLLREPEAALPLLVESAKSPASLSELVGVLVNARDGQLLFSDCDLDYHINICCGFMNGITEGSIEVAAATVAVILLVHIGATRLDRETFAELRNRLMRITVALNPWSLHKPHMAHLVGLLATLPAVPSPAV